MNYGRSKVNLPRGSGWSCVGFPALFTSYVAVAKAEEKRACFHQPLCFVQG